MFDHLTGHEISKRQEILKTCYTQTIMNFFFLTYIERKKTQPCVSREKEDQL